MVVPPPCRASGGLSAVKRKKRVPVIGAAFALLLVLAAFFFLRLSLHRPPTVELPTQEREAHSGEVIAKAEQDTLRRVEVTPQTVQLVIERLARPENYRRTIVIERYWSGASGMVTVSVSVADGWTRVDQTDANGEVRHSITSPEESWIWYGGARSVYHGAASVSADEEQSIPTYENILWLDAAEIAVADYRALNGVNCIYVETVADAADYVDRYYIAVDSGLLVTMERVRDGTAAYVMSSLSVERDAVGAEAFTLPDGTALYDPALYAENRESEGI